MFSERQWLVRNPVIWAVAAVVAAALGSAGGAAWAFGSRRDALYVGITGGILGLLLTGNLATRVEPRRLVLAYWPLWRRTVELVNVRRAYAQPYQWWRFGGWGIRVGAGAIAFSVWGKKAVRLDLEGWDLVVTTRDPDALLRALEAEGVRVEYGESGAGAGAGAAPASAAAGADPGEAGTPGLGPTGPGS